MNDFMNNFWPYFIAIVTIVGIVGCALLLWITSKIKIVSANGDNTSGHVWDENIVEMNNPLPRWWVWLFIITIIFGFIYLALYPGLATYDGSKGWTQESQYEEEVAEANEALKPIYAKFADMPIEDLATLPVAQSIGERLYMNNCSQCHASDARGSRGFPNLTDNDWLYGGSPEKIQETITNGRNGMMPPMGAMVGSDEDIKSLANYVLSLSGSMHDAAKAGLGKEKFATCAACHGADGKGNQSLGAPNLADNVWLHGAGEAAIIDRIKNGKVNQMPAQKDKLTPEQIKVLASYIWGLSNVSSDD
ncbi:MAG: cytochrome-c oxidase, cbb3-type subunit III [Methylophilaceae bacterium]